MFFKPAALVLAFVLTPLAIHAQSLGTIAQKEKNRRDENRDRGAKVREFSESEIFGEPEPEPEPEEDESEASPPQGVAAGGPLDDEDTDPQSDLDSDDGADRSTDELEREAGERRREEARWRELFAEARRELRQLRDYRQSLDELYLTHGERYVDDAGNTVIQDLDHLRMLIRQADEQLEAAEDNLSQLERRARQENVPPGWRR